MPALARQAVDSYRQTEVQSRTPLELVVMLYDGALRFIAQARDAIERKDIRARHQAITRTMAIVSELQSTLDMEKGGAVSESLDSLYVYVNGCLLEAGTNRDVHPLDEAAKVLTALRDAWAEIAGSTATQRAAR